MPDFSQGRATWVLLSGALDTEESTLIAQTSDLGTSAVLVEPRTRRIYSPPVLGRSS